ncbi:MAG: transporter [Candidatus Eremiobacter antarcticus]|nr:formate/nitrite transporter family protein [Candidatus Eremiobacteraeota bacterium]MBC5807118.1 formate/nitrite transporter family protein [Candidatus Eremiobacteraeota bacterium]PZR62423.1 MAG: transporter [Candidatus Eremiobacter sp. RRmetagenome_bin22]
MADAKIPRKGKPLDEVPSEIPLTDRERDQVEERARPRTAVVHETIRAEGEGELKRPVASLAWSGLAAGLSMGFSLMAVGVLRAHLPDEPWRPLIANLGYTVGFLIVVMGRQQLFTENTLTPILPLLYNKDSATLFRVARLWAVVLATNLAGASLFAFALSHSGIFDERQKAVFAQVSTESMAGTFWVIFWKGVFAGWLIALMVWLLPAAESAQAAVIVVLTYLVGIAGLAHVIVGSVEAFYLISAGDLTWLKYFSDFFAPVLLGNVVGGVALVAALARAQVIPEEGAS